MQRFTAMLTPIRGGGHFVAVPDETAEAAGLRYGVRVRGSVNGVAYRSSLMKYSGVFHMGVHKATIAAAGVVSGAEVAVAIEIDDGAKPSPRLRSGRDRADWLLNARDDVVDLREAEPAGQVLPVDLEIRALNLLPPQASAPVYPNALF